VVDWDVTCGDDFEVGASDCGVSFNKNCVVGCVVFQIRTHLETNGIGCINRKVCTAVVLCGLEGYLSFDFEGVYKLI